MTVLHEGAVRRLTDAGCSIDGDDQVKIPARLVETAIESVPENISVYDREGNLAMELGGRRAYFGTGSDLMFTLESDGVTRRPTTIDDIKAAARVGDALPNIDFIMSFGHPQEMNPHAAYLASFQAMVENCSKPIVTTAEGRSDLAAMWEISKALRGGEAAYREKPHWIQYAEPISPLKHPFSSLDKLMFCAETGSPVIYSPAPIAGSTAPMTIAGHVVQGLAESLFGLVVHQLTSEGTPFLMGMGPAVLDMATSQCSYNAPEYLMAYMAITEMAKHLNIPNWGYAGTSDSQVPDMQAAFEAGLETFMAAFAGANLNHDVGYLDFGLTGSLEMIVVVNEMIDQIRRMQKGIPVTPETLALDVIPRGAKEGQFLTQPHTLKHLRKVQWRPTLFNRHGYERWNDLGRADLLTQARRRLKTILDTHQPRPLPEDIRTEIDSIVTAFAGR
jgi:trimethylamine--corrinoid protein Co-methyltransferase